MYGWLASQLGLDHVTCEMSALQGVHRRRGSRLVVHGQYEQPQQYRQPRVAGESSLGGTRAERRLSRRERSPGWLGISGLFGYIATFLGASIFNVAEGIPLLPLQTLWVSFTMLSIQSVGLGYSKPAAGLMERPPLPPSRPILTRALIAWLALVGLLMAIGTLSVISWADHEHGLAIARTMGMVTFALFILFFSIESKDQRDSAFSLDTFSDKTFIITTSGSFVLLVLSTVLSIFQAVMKTVRLDVRQWLICTAVALTIVAAAEIRKAALRQAAAKAIHPARGPGPEPLPAERPPGA
jgi:hypothetical protein